MKLYVNEVFGPTIQGEGQRTGVPSVFMRLTGCNLRCAFAGGSLCDTPYTSHNSEPPITETVQEAFNMVRDIFLDNPRVTDLVITGGEPMLQQEGLYEFVKLFTQNFPLHSITMESNGTIVPKHNMFIDLYSCSPKLSTSECFEGTSVPEAFRKAHSKARKNYEAVYKTMQLAVMSQLKFVYSNADSGKEILEWLDGFNKYRAELDDVYYEVLIMPEGTEVDQLDNKSKEVVDFCIENGFTFCDRLHIRIWGSKRAV